MLERQKLKLASLLYKYMFPLYRKMYFSFKNRKDFHHLKLIERLIQPGSTIFDIGANIGFYSKFFSDHVGTKGHVYCFEPDPVNFKYLEAEMKHTSNVSLVGKAVAASSGKLELYKSPLLNVDHRSYETEGHAGKVTVDKISIDDFVQNRFKVSFIKLDIQGFEMEALRGMKKTLESNEDVIIFMELWNHGLIKAGSSAREVVDFLSVLNFNLYTTADDQLTIFLSENANDLPAEFFSDIHLLATRKKIDQ